MVRSWGEPNENKLEPTRVSPCVQASSFQQEKLETLFTKLVQERKTRKEKIQQELEQV